MANHPDSATLPQAPVAGAVARGTVVAGKYVVDVPLGEGGMGVVMRAQHLTLQEPVAIKFLKPAEAGDTKAIERFVREARAAAKVKNEHIVTVFDVGVHEGKPFIVMELVEGQGLGDLVCEKGPLDVALAVDLLLQASDAMADAHARGIVHRDLKSNNLMLTRRGDGGPHIKVLDFGLATAPTELDGARHEVGITSTHASFGSPAYMPPEQIRAARDADARADVWALGVILYELLTGQLPFPGTTVPAVLAAIAADPPRPLVDHRPELGALWLVIERCLRKAPQERFASVVDFAVALAPFASVEGALVAARAQRRRAGAGSLPAPAPSGSTPASLRFASSPLTGATSTTAAAMPAPLQRSKTSRASLALALALVAGGLGLVRIRPWASAKAPAAPDPAAALVVTANATTTIAGPSASSATPSVAAPVASSGPAAAPSASAPIPTAIATAPAVPGAKPKSRAASPARTPSGSSSAREPSPLPPATSKVDDQRL